MKKIVVLIALICIILPSCSLLKFQLNEEGAVPLSKTEMNIRVYTHTYISTFFSELEDAVDSLKQVTDDPKIIGQSLVWLMNNESAVQGAVFQVDPKVALADTWLLSIQMVDFLEHHGKKYFGDYTSILLEPTQSLNDQITQAAQRMLNHKEYETMQNFVSEQRFRHRISEINYTRDPIYAQWLRYNNMPDTSAISTVGSLSQVIAGFSDRFSVMGGQIGKIAQWQLELASLYTGITPETFKAIGDSANVRMDEFMELINQMPYYLDTTLVKISGDLLIITSILDDRIALTMATLQQERQALETMVAREREIIMNDVDSISVHVTQTLMQKATEMLKEVLLYLCLLFAIILFIPFGLGYATGRIFTKQKFIKKQKKKNNIPSNKDLSEEQTER